MRDQVHFGGRRRSIELRFDAFPRSSIERVRGGIPALD